jgi:hypothetical protein
VIEFGLALVASFSMLSPPQDAAKSSAAPKEEVDKERKICREEPNTGSRLRARKICRTAAEWEQLRQSAMRDLSRSQTNAR